MEKINKAIKFFEGEIVSLRKAPELNGCEMTTEWMELMQIYNIALESIKSQHVPEIKTNYDRIKAMTIDDVAEAIYRNDDFDVTVPYCKCMGECADIVETLNQTVPKEMCIKCVKTWLESEAVR